MSGIAGITFSPLLPWPALLALAAPTLLLLGYSAFRRAAGTGWRALALGTGLLALANPALISEQRAPLDDVAVVIVDRSGSQGIGDRGRQTDQALERLRKRLARFSDLEVREVSVGGADDDGAAADQETRLFAALEKALADTPRGRVAAAILVTDGQVHDVPAEPAQLRDGPLHVLLTGAPGQRDRRLVIEDAPKYGIVGGRISVKLRVEDLGAVERSGLVRLSLRIDGGEPVYYRIPAGVSRDIPIELGHGGPTVLEIEAEPGPAELTPRNNRAALVVNGVRDRLRVLLVSGQPHAGERNWRNLLKADPSVDLIHFTILRPPDKQDGTPVDELSLIAFPSRQLFEVKINEFDLIIFDRYRRRGVLPSLYIENIAKYVRGGGAVLEAAGPAFATPLSLYGTPLGEILPGAPSGVVIEQGYRPLLTAQGRRHPVTAELPGRGNAAPEWGRWFRLIDVDATRGAVLMSGAQERPLLILDRVDEGRVAQLLSDHGWLWARGFEGGGPQAELLRRLAHWLMKEPELEENDLRLVSHGNRLEIVRRSLEPSDEPVIVTAPSGKTSRVRLTEEGGGRAVTAFEARETGLYRAVDGSRRAVAVVGAFDTREYADVRATAEHLSPLASVTGGGVSWLAEDGLPELRRIRPGRRMSGRGWIGLREGGEYLVTGVKRAPLPPGWLVLVLILGGLMLAWRREGA